MIDPRFEDPRVYTHDIEDHGAREVYVIESLTKLSTQEAVRAIGDPTLGQDRSRLRATDSHTKP
jgi:hypothetical protein